MRLLRHAWRVLVGALATRRHQSMQARLRILGWRGWLRRNTCPAAWRPTPGLRGLALTGFIAGGATMLGGDWRRLSAACCAMREAPGQYCGHGSVRTLQLAHRRAGATTTMICHCGTHSLTVWHPTDCGGIRRWPGALTDLSQRRWVSSRGLGATPTEPGCWQWRSATHQWQCRPFHSVLAQNFRM